MNRYTHNLKLILVDNNGNIVSDNVFLDHIKTKLCKPNMLTVKWNMKNIAVTIGWERRELSEIEQQFMGDLFIDSIYGDDMIIIEHTTQVISSLKSNYTIKFHITKPAGKRTVCRESYGLL